MLTQVGIIFLALVAGLATVFYAPIKKMERYFIPALLTLVALLTINALGAYPYAIEATVAIVFFITAFPSFMLISEYKNTSKPKWLHSIDVILFAVLIATTASYLAVSLFAFKVPNEKTPYISKQHWQDHEGYYEHRTYQDGLEYVISTDKKTPEELPWEIYFRQGTNSAIKQYIKHATEKSVTFNTSYNERTAIILSSDMTSDVEYALKNRLAAQAALVHGGVKPDNFDTYWIKTNPTDAFVMKINNTPTYKYTEDLFAYNVRHVLREIKAKGFEVAPYMPLLHVVTLATPRPTEGYTHENAWKHLIDVEIIVPIVTPQNATA